MTLVWEEVGEHIASFLETADDHVYVFAPFIQPEALQRILPASRSATVVTSWRADHVRSGASSLEVYELCRRHGRACLKIHPRLHLKVFGIDVSRDGGRIMIGSANVTDTALGWCDDDQQVNREVMVEGLPLSLLDRVSIERIIVEAQLVTEDLYERFRSWLDEIGPSPASSLERPPQPADPEQFLVTMLPLSDSPSRLYEIVSAQQRLELEWWEEDAAVHDLALYRPGVASRDGFTQDLKRAFFRQTFVAALTSELPDDGWFFGEIKEWIQTRCRDVPTPRRRELTQNVMVLLKWITELNPKEYEVVRPRHSECLRRR